jgi:steroid 5-alpha reductase family enzyme
MTGLTFWISLSLVVLLYMSLWYAVAIYTSRYDVVDSAWGIGFVVIAWVSIVLSKNYHPLTFISAGLVTIWGLRLFIHIANRNWRKHEDDHRYVTMRAKWGSAEKRKAYTNVFLLQGILLILVSTPMIAIARSSHTITLGVLIGWIVWLAGILFEGISDRQLASFLHRRESGSHELMCTGLWRYSRHPNYFGEVATWWGAGIVAISIGSWWGILGTAVITVLITKVSGIPPLEKHYAGNKDYQAYAKKTSVLIPLPPKS